MTLFPAGAYPVLRGRAVQAQQRAITVGSSFLYQWFVAPLSLGRCCLAFLFSSFLRFLSSRLEEGRAGVWKLVGGWVGEWMGGTGQHDVVKIVAVFSPCASRGKK